MCGLIATVRASTVYITAATPSKAPLTEIEQVICLFIVQTNTLLHTQVEIVNPGQEFLNLLKKNPHQKLQNRKVITGCQSISS